MSERLIIERSRDPGKSQVSRKEMLEYIRADQAARPKIVAIWVDEWASPSAAQIGDKDAGTTSKS